MNREDIFDLVLIISYISVVALVYKLIAGA